MRKLIPAFGSPENPADITAAVFNDTTLFARTLDVVLEDPGLDQLSILLASISGPRAAHSAEVIAAAAAKTDKPVTSPGRAGRPSPRRPRKALEAARVPFVTTPVRLARAAAVLARFAADRRRLLPRKTPERADAQGRRPAGRAPSPSTRPRARRCCGPSACPSRKRGVRGRRRRRGRGQPGAQGAVRGQGRVARRAAQDGSRRRQARRVARGAGRGRPHGHRQRAQGRARAPRSTACWCRRWRRASRR